jgi:hypothetical protein
MSLSAGTAPATVTTLSQYLLRRLTKASQSEAANTLHGYSFEYELETDSMAVVNKTPNKGG